MHLLVLGWELATIQLISQQLLIQARVVIINNLYNNARGIRINLLLSEEWFHFAEAGCESDDIYIYEEEEEEEEC